MDIKYVVIDIFLVVKDTNEVVNFRMWELNPIFVVTVPDFVVMDINHVVIDIFLVVKLHK